MNTKIANLSNFMTSLVRFQFGAKFSSVFFEELRLGTTNSKPKPPLKTRHFKISNSIFFHFVTVHTK